MEEDYRKELLKAGSDAATSVLIGFAIALAVRDRADPRGDLVRDMSSLEERFAPLMSKQGLAEDTLEAMGDGYRERILDVARLADSFLISWGAPPASDV